MRGWKGDSLEHDTASKGAKVEEGATGRMQVPGLPVDVIGSRLGLKVTAAYCLARRGTLI